VADIQPGMRMLLVNAPATLRATLKEAFPSAAVHNVPSIQEAALHYATSPDNYTVAVIFTQHPMRASEAAEAFREHVCRNTPVLVVGEDEDTLVACKTVQPQRGDEYLDADLAANPATLGNAVTVAILRRSHRRRVATGAHERSAT